VKSEGARVVFGYILICVLWGSTWLAIKIGLESLPPFLGAALRFAVAMLLFFLIIAVRRIPIPCDRRSLGLYTLVGVCTFSAGYALIYWGQQYVGTGLAAVLFGTLPFFVGGLSWFVFRSERLTTAKAAGILTGFAGIVVIFSEDVAAQYGESSLAGMLVIILAASIISFSTVMVKKYGKEIASFSLNAVAMGVGSALLLLLSVWTEDWSGAVFDGRAVVSVLYLATFGSVITFGILFWLLKRMEAVILSLSAFLTPIVALVLGAVIAREPFTMRLFAGTVLVLAGILIVNNEGIRRLLRRGG
jgi:drug/metabolite transporter (DMT)-like permease